MKVTLALVAALVASGCVVRKHNVESATEAYSDSAIGCFKFSGRSPDKIKSYSFGKPATEICIARTAPTVDGDNATIVFNYKPKATADDAEVVTEILASFTGRDESSPDYGDIRFRLTRGTVLEKEVDRGEISSANVTVFQGNFLIDNKTYKALKSY